VSKPKRKPGRPRKQIDEQKLDLLASIGCTYAEMAAALGCHPDTLYNNFRDKIELARGDGKTKLRRAQWKRALSGSDKMLVHLGKHHLGQSDVIKHEIDAHVEHEEVSRARDALERKLARRFAVTRVARMAGGDNGSSG